MKCLQKFKWVKLPREEIPILKGMSAYCIDVAKLAEKCQLEFAWVSEKLFLFGMFVFDLYK